MATHVNPAARLCGACGAADAPSQCGGCKAMYYCNAACQKAGWGGHKAACVAAKVGPAKAGPLADAQAGPASSRVASRLAI